MTLLPARGDGHRTNVRGWTDRAQREGALTWPAWNEPLSTAGIDALLDAHWSGHHLTAVTRQYTSVPYRPRGQMDQTRGYASRPITSTQFTSTITEPGSRAIEAQDREPPNSP